MKLNIYYDAESDTLSLWNGVPASEGEDVADNLVADYASDGCVVGFTLEHAAKVLKADLTSLGNSSQYETDDVSISEEMIVLQKLKRAFPDYYAEKKSDFKFSFRWGATIYVRKTRSGQNTARIHSQRLKNFPNSQKLGAFVKRCCIPIDSSKSHPDYMLGPDHVDELIAILQQ